MKDLKWIGLDAQTFRPYQHWKNTGSVGECGSYVSAVLAHYLVKRDTNNDLSLSTLLKGLKGPIDHWPLHKGSYMWNLSFSLNYLLKPAGYQAHYGLLTEKKVPELIKAGKGPVIVGTTSILGSAYGNHWVLVYAYAYDEEGNLYYHAYDNHGKYQAIIPAKETIGYVYVSEIISDTTQRSQIPVTTIKQEPVHFVMNSQFVAPSKK